MSKRKYMKTNMIRTLAEFENSKCMWFEIHSGSNMRMWHRSALLSLQVHTLQTWLKGGYVYETKEIKRKGIDK